jgi:hypothetical protein
MLADGLVGDAELKGQLAATVATFREFRTRYLGRLGSPNA